jgi:hypothetical protein
LENQAQLFEPGEYIDRKRPGYFTLAAKPGGDGSWRQHSYPVEHLATVVNGVNPRIDSYVTQAVFDRSGTSIVDVRDTAVLFADLDTHEERRLAGKTPEELAAQLCAFCAEVGIPAPSVVLFSGRGLQAKWLLTSAIPRVDLHLWNQAERALVQLLAPFAADQGVVNINRVLRLDRTVNTKSGELCRVVYVTGGAEDCPARYDFEELRALLVNTQAETVPVEEKRQRKDRPPLALPQGFGLMRLNWTRLEDLRTLWRLRGGVPKGRREVTLFWQLNFLLMAQPGKPVDIWRAAESLAREISSETFYTPGERGTLSTLYRKAKEALPIYTPRNAYLIDVFRITLEEERELRTIISAGEKYRRKVARRWAEGRERRRVDRSDKPWEALGISRATWYRRSP